jgi:hypothetical protein
MTRDEITEWARRQFYIAQRDYYVCVRDRPVRRFHLTSREIYFEWNYRGKWIPLGHALVSDLEVDLQDRLIGLQRRLLGRVWERRRRER